MPWPEALVGAPYPALVEAELARRALRTPAGETVYLALTPLSTLRDGLANYWSNDGPVPPTGPWAGRRLDHPRVIEAYLRYCLDLVARFEPDYLAYAIEVDLLADNDPAAFERFRGLARKLYRRIKREHPELPVFLTFTLGQPGEWERKKDVLRPLLPYTDLLAISTYPYLVAPWGGRPERIPTDWFRRVRELDSTKPIAIAETGHSAEDLELESFGITIPGRPSWQKRYVRRLLTEADELAMEFVVWFTVVDYDALWELMAAAGVSEVFKAWRDTGLYDQDLRRRPAATLWRRQLRRPVE